MPNGYDTIIDDDATNVPAGEKQILTIARALVADPPILILDEATSSVDKRTEVLVQQAIGRLLEGRTILVIAHRLSIIPDGHTILVMDHGSILDQGNHDEFLARGGPDYEAVVRFASPRGTTHRYSVLMRSRVAVSPGPKRLASPWPGPIADATTGLGPTLPKIVSLFAGAGGLDLGFQRAGFPLSFAVDLSPEAIQTHRRNFKDTVAVAADLAELGPDGVLAHLRGLIEPGESIGVIGGPPCQGFSRANPGSTATDPRNQLPLLYMQIVEALQAEYTVEFVLFENVLGIRDTKHSIMFDGILAKFLEIGFKPDVSDYSALDFGVAQTRNRVIISGFRDEVVAKHFKPKTVIASDLTVRAKIESLPEPAFFARDLNRAAIPHHENHWTMRPVSKRFSRPGGADRAGRSFRRLQWDKPSPTVAYGHREIHVHPEGQRRLSIYEAMLLQGFPSTFVIEGTFSSQVEQVSNAVPPPMAESLASAIKVAMRHASRQSAAGRAKRDC